MYERAMYLKNKFIRNGIALFTISALLIYYAATKSESFSPVLIIVPVAVLIWLYLGLWINKKLKLKVANKDSEITDVSISYKQVEFILSVLLVAVIFLLLKHWVYANYLTNLILIAYCYWSYIQIKMLNNYFNA